MLFRFSNRSREVGPARVARQNVNMVRAFPNGGERRSAFVTDPTTGALVLRPDLELKFERSMKRVVRRMKRDLYLHLAFLYFIKFRLKLEGVVLHLRRDLARLFH